MYSHTLPACAGAVVRGAVMTAALLAAIVAAIIVALSFGLPIAFAQSTDDPLTILVTASRHAETADETLAPVSVITRSDIEKRQASTVEEVLRAVPGISFGNSGGIGKQTSLFLRGSESNHVLVLIDGVKVGALDSGLTRFEHLPLDEIDKIEVVRGPRSSLYGSEAIGGVIQIFTRKGQRESIARPQFGIAAGSHSSGKYNAGVSGGGENAWYRIGASGHKTDGYDACRGKASQGTFGEPDYVPGAGCFTDEPDDDGYQHQSFALRGGAAFGGFSLEGNFLSSQSESMFDGGFTNEVDHTAQTASVNATWRAHQNWRTALLIGQSTDEIVNAKDGTRGSMPETTRDQANWQNDFHFGLNRLSIGVDRIDDQVESSYQRERANLGVFALWRGAAGASDFELAVRNDDDDVFGNHATGSIAWGRDFTDPANRTTRMTASIASAFKAPTFGELYGFGGNPDLQPEQSRSVNLGLSHDGENLSLALDLYRTEIENLIDYTPSLGNINVDEARILGVELSGATRIGEWDWAVQLGVLDAEEIAGPRAGDELARRPHTKLDVDVSRQFARWSVGGNLYAQTASRDLRADFGGGRNAGFQIVNLRGEYHFHRDWAIGLKVNNVFDAEYETAAYYPQDGVNFMSTLRYRPRH